MQGNSPWTMLRKSIVLSPKANISQTNKTEELGN